MRRGQRIRLLASLAVFLGVVPVGRSATETRVRSPDGAIQLQLSWPKGRFQWAAVSVETIAVKRTERLGIDLRAGGGFIGRFSRDN